MTNSSTNVYFGLLLTTTHWHINQRYFFSLQFEFDEATGVFENGSLLFKKSFVTYTVGKASKRFRLSGNFDIADIDGMGVEISKQVRSRVF